MRSFLVDFENVKSKGLVGIDQLGSDDHVVIFYSENSDTISFDMHCSVMRAAASVEYMKVNVGGKNALDFQLSTLLGYMVAQQNNSHIFIISNDKGFDKLHDFWENTFNDAPPCVVFRTQNIAAAINYAKSHKAASIELGDIAEQAEELIAETVALPEQADAPEEKPAKKADMEIMVPEAMIQAFRPDKEKASASKPAHERRIEITTNAYIPETSAPSEPNEPSEPAARPADITDAQFAKYMDIARAAEGEELPLSLFKLEEGRLRNVLNELNRSICLRDLRKVLVAAMGCEDGEYIASELTDHYDRIKARLAELSAQEQEAETADDAENAENAAEPKKVDADMKKKLHALLDPIATKDEFSGTVAQINISATPQQLYINMIKRFNKKRGCVLYKAIKAEFKRFIEPAAEEPAPAEPKKADNTMKKKLHTLLDPIASNDEFSGVVSLINRSADSQELAANMTQRFGTERGSELYEIVESDFMDFTGEAAAVNAVAAAVDESPKQEEPAEIAAEKAPEKTEQPEQKAKEQKPAKKRSAAGKTKSEKAVKPKKSEKKKAEPAEQPEELSPEYAAKLEDGVRAALKGKSNAEETAAAVEVALASRSKHDLYIGMVKKFKKKRGLVIYNEIKEGCEKLAAERSAAK